MSIFSGPMFTRSDEGWRRSSKEGGHYNIFAATHDPEASMAALRDWFSDAESVNEMNFVLFSTSGVHGTYTTIDEIERSMRKYPDGPPNGDDWPDDYSDPEITFLIVQPRIVGMTYGLAKVRSFDDVKWIRRIQRLTAKAVAKIGKDDK